MASKLESAIRTVVEFLDQQGYRYAIIGGIALSHWGMVRATYDVDIKVMVPDNDYPAARHKLQSLFSQQARPELPPNSLIVAGTVEGVIVGFLLALPGYEELNEAYIEEWLLQFADALEVVLLKHPLYLW